MSNLIKSYHFVLYKVSQSRITAHMAAKPNFCLAAQDVPHIFAWPLLKLSCGQMPEWRRGAKNTQEAADFE
jgi:hypothetical protein